MLCNPISLRKEYCIQNLIDILVKESNKRNTNEK